MLACHFMLVMSAQAFTDRYEYRSAWFVVDVQHIIFPNLVQAFLKVNSNGQACINVIGIYWLNYYILTLQ